MKQALAELCQAQAQIGLSAEAKPILTVEYKFLVFLGKTYNYSHIYTASFQLSHFLLRSCSMEAMLHGYHLPSIQIFPNILSSAKVDLQILESKFKLGLEWNVRN